MIRWTAEQLRAAAIDRRKLEAVLEHLAAAHRLMGRLGLSVYACDGCAYLIHDSRPEHVSDGRGGLVADHDAIVATGPTGRFDGGGW